MSNTHAKSREQSHAKLLSYQGRQVLAYLYRDKNDGLCVAMQVWVASTDEQLRVSVSYPSIPDEVVAGLFEDLDDAQVAHDFEQLGVAKILAGSDLDG